MEHGSAPEPSRSSNHTFARPAFRPNTSPKTWTRANPRRRSRSAAAYCPTGQGPGSPLPGMPSGRGAASGMDRRSLGARPADPAPWVVALVAGGGGPCAVVPAEGNGGVGGGGVGGGGGGGWRGAATGWGGGGRGGARGGGGGGGWGGGGAGGCRWRSRAGGVGGGWGRGGNTSQSAWVVGCGGKKCRSGRQFFPSGQRDRSDWEEVPRR